MTPSSFSPWDMFTHAGPLVKAVMGLLILASLLSWTIFVAKTVEFMQVRIRLNRAERALSEAKSMARGLECARCHGGISQQFMLAALTERQQSEDVLGDREGLKERIVLHLERLEAAEGRRLARGTGLLATIGATSPFIGLFGTVWGIVTAFSGIAAAHATSLAVVAPGIAEALMATALGLFAAIPAVVIYNHFVRQTIACRAQVADITSLVMRIVSRDLSRLSASPRPGNVLRFDTRALVSE